MLVLELTATDSVETPWLSSPVGAVAGFWRQPVLVLALQVRPLKTEIRFGPPLLVIVAT